MDRSEQDYAEQNIIRDLRSPGILRSVGGNSLLTFHDNLFAFKGQQIKMREEYD
jgi:hypothetical protein